MMNSCRQKQFQRNERLERLLLEINSLLDPLQKNINKNYSMPEFPVLLVIGGPRSGSTLMMQWLADTGNFAYPTNLLSRFYGAPYFGAKIQQLLTGPDFNFKNELSDFNDYISFASDLGKTQGALEPNDFWYFWRRFLPNTEPVYLNDQLLKKVKGKEFVAEIATIESVFAKPFAMKGMILEQNIPFLSSLFEKVLFLYIKRHPFFNIQSLLEARVKFHGDRRKWYSIKPKEYDELRKLDPVEQVTGQVYFKNCAVDKGLSQIGSSRCLQVNYEDFCMDPESLFRRLKDKLALQCDTDDWQYQGPERFQSANTIRLPDKDCKRIIDFFKKLSGRDITP